MSEREELMKLVWLAGSFESSEIEIGEATDAILADGWRKPRTIMTTDEVDALPSGSIVKTVYGDGVNIYRNELITPAMHHHVVAGGPATVLYEPEVAA